ncbi:hypothetical protein [Saccharopolyspora elongata]|nr:hypothetical protein [Saccharopolyspora elongata]
MKQLLGSLMQDVQTNRTAEELAHHAPTHLPLGSHRGPDVDDR